MLPSSDGRLVVMGGLSTLTKCALDTVEIYDLTAKCWLPDVPKLPRKLMGAKCVLVSKSAP